MSVSESDVGPYSSPPDPGDPRIRVGMDAFQPEAIEGLSWDRPDISSDEHRIVLRFSIDRKKRPNRDSIPCAMCSGRHPKCLSGSVLWSADGWLRVIGHICARKPENFGEARFRRLQQERVQRELDDAALDWLSNNLLAIRSTVGGVQALHRAMIYMEEQQRIFFRGVPVLARQLCEIVTRGGAKLTVAREVSATRLAAASSVLQPSGSSLTSRYEEAEVGVVRGGTFVKRPRRSRSDQVMGILQAFSLIPDGDGEEPILKLIDSGDAEKVTIVAGALLRAVQRVIVIADEYADAALFMSNSNLDALAAWGSHADAGLSFSIRRSDQEIIFRLTDFSRARLSAKWPSVVDLSGWNTLAEAGVNLNDKLQEQSRILRIRDTSDDGM